jgi:hypothetical protein
VLAAVAVAVVAGLVLGEYAFDGLAIVGGGVVVGLFVSEAAVTVNRGRSRLLGAACAGLTVLGLLVAARTATGHRLSEVRWEGWLAVVLGATAAVLRAVPLRARSRTPAEPPPEG